jgi:ABC-type microcin C transport system duplicated ATPase subunit YejF
VLDEPTASLDMSMRVQILALLHRLQSELETTFLFISHDLGTVRSLCTRVLVLSQGEIVEQGPVDRIFDYARHPDTQSLVAQPRPDTPMPEPFLRRFRRKRPSSFGTNHTPRMD